MSMGLICPACRRQGGTGSISDAVDTGDQERLEKRSQAAATSGGVARSSGLVQVRNRWWESAGLNEAVFGQVDPDDHGGSAQTVKARNASAV